MRRAVVGSVNGGEGIFTRKGLVEARRSEIFPHVLHRIGESFGNSAWRSRGGRKFGAVGYRPQSEQRAYASNCAGARGRVRHECDVASAQVLAELLVIRKQK